MSLPLLHAGKSAPGLSAALDLRFALDKSLTAYRGPTPSFSRASTGTYFNSSGVLTSAAINAPRFNHTFNGTSWVSRGLLVEEQRTNLLQYSESFGTSPWSSLGSPTITTNTDIAPDGSQTSDTINDTSNSSFWGVAQSFSASSGSTYTFSIYIKKTSVSPTNYPLIQMQVGASSYSGIIINTFTGAISVVSGGSYVAPTSYNFSDNSNYWRISITAVINLSTSQVQFYPAGSSDGSTISSAATGAAVVWGAMMELGAFPTSYIGTTGSSVVRSADVCQITGTDFSGMWNQGEGSVFTEFDTNAPSVPLATSGFNTQIFAARDSSNNQRIYLGTENFGGRRFYIDDGAGSSSVISPGALIGNGVVNKASVAWKTNDMAASFDGASVLTDNSQIIPLGITAIDFGKSPANTNYLCGHIAKLIYYPARLTNTKLQQLST